MSVAWDGIEGQSFSAFILSADTSAPQVARKMGGLLTDRESTGYRGRVVTSFDVTGDDLADDIRRASALIPPVGSTLCYVSGRHEVIGDDITVAGPPSTTLSEVVGQLVTLSLPLGLLVVIDSYGAGDGLHPAAVGALIKASPACPWCVISEAVDLDLVVPDETPLIQGFVGGLGIDASTHIDMWFQANRLQGRASDVAADIGTSAPMLTASESPAIRVGFVERVPAPQEFHEGLEVALSGGGYRASAFSLGAMLYLAHAGLNKSVESIVSVSGGSITNAWIAKEIDFKDDIGSVEDFVDCARGLASRLSRTSLLSPRNAYFLAWAGLLVGMVALAGWSAASTWPWSSSDILASVGIAMTVAVLIRLRGWVVTRWLAQTFCRSTKYCRMDDLATRKVNHVFATTDLCTGAPFFMFSRGGARTFGSRWGLRHGRSVRLSTAVRASAALPPLLPAVRLKLEERLDGVECPQAIWLSDGGVWNNLGTDWSRLRNEILNEEMKPLSDEQQIDALVNSESTAAASGGVQLVIDASGSMAQRRMRTMWIPILSFAMTAIRTTLTSYTSTVAARRPEPTEARDRMLLNPQRWWVDWPQPPVTWNQMAGSALPLELVVSMGDPGHIADRWQIKYQAKNWEHVGSSYREELAAIDPSLGGYRVFRKVSLVARILNRLFGYSVSLDQSNLVPTTLNGLGRQTTASLIFEGYMATRETLDVAFENHRPPAIPSVPWFEHVVGWRAAGHRPEVLGA